MRASICSPGTAVVIGVRLGGSGEITPRSVTGVKAPDASPGNELLAGVVSALLVVRSVLSKQLTSARSLPIALSTSAQVVAACAENGTTSNSAAAPQIRRNIIYCAGPPDCIPPDCIPPD